MFLFLLTLKFFMGLPEPQEAGERSKAVIDVVHRLLTFKGVERGLWGSFAHSGLEGSLRFNRRAHLTGD